MQRSLQVYHYPKILGKPPKLLAHGRCYTRSSPVSFDLILPEYQSCCICTRPHDNFSLQFFSVFETLLYNITNRKNTELMQALCYSKALSAQFGLRCHYGMPWDCMLRPCQWKNCKVSRFYSWLKTWDEMASHPAPECACSRDAEEMLVGEVWVRASSESLQVGRCCAGTVFKISSCSWLICKTSFGDKILMDRTQLTNSSHGSSPTRRVSFSWSTNTSCQPDLTVSSSSPSKLNMRASSLRSST